MVVEDAEPVGIGLADAINQVRTELERTIKDGEKNSIAFRAGTVELEFQVLTLLTMVDSRRAYRADLLVRGLR